MVVPEAQRTEAVSVAPVWTAGLSRPAGTCCSDDSVQEGASKKAPQEM